MIIFFQNSLSIVTSSFCPLSVDFANLLYVHLLEVNIFINAHLFSMRQPNIKYVVANRVMGDPTKYYFGEVLQ